MALWCLWSAPLLMSNDLRDMMPGTKEILLNRKLIAVDQDSWGIMGKKILQVYESISGLMLDNFYRLEKSVVIANRCVLKQIILSMRLCLYCLIEDLKRCKN